MGRGNRAWRGGAGRFCAHRTKKPTNGRPWGVENFWAVVFYVAEQSELEVGSEFGYY